MITPSVMFDIPITLFQSIWIPRQNDTAGNKVLMHEIEMYCVGLRYEEDRYHGSGFRYENHVWLYYIQCLQGDPSVRIYSWHQVDPTSWSMPGRIFDTKRTMPSLQIFVQ